MKKGIGILTVAIAAGTISTMFVGCGGTNTDKSNTKSGTEETVTTASAVNTNLYNVTENEVERKTYVDLEVPDNAKNVVYNIIAPDSERPIGEVEYTYNGKEMYMRGQVSDYTPRSFAGMYSVLSDDSPINISGLNYKWDTAAAIMAGDEYDDEYDAFIFTSKEGAGYEAWVNDEGVLFNLCMKKNVDVDLIQKVANEVAD